MIKIQLPLFIDKTALPTKKNHVSFSEIYMWEECSYKHKLTHVDGLKEDDENEHLIFGSAAHSFSEDWLLNKHYPSFNFDDRIKKCRDDVIAGFERIKFNSIEKQAEITRDWINPIDTILRQLPGWMDQQFPDWELVAAEMDLFEPIEKQTNKFFKGFVDVILKIPKSAPKRKSKKPYIQEYVYWVLDLKSTSWGWNFQKKTDPHKRMQLSLYKHFVSKKLGIPLKEIKCGFILLKRTAKLNSQIELVEVSIGDKTRTDALDVMAKVIGSIAKGFVTKNRNNCRYCPYFNTKNCT